MGSKICHEPPSGEWKDMKCQSYTPEFISPKFWVELTIRKNINDKVKFCFSHNILLCSLSGLNIVCIDKVRGRSWNFGFCGFWGMSKIFDFKGVALWGYITQRKVSLFSICFPILKCKISKTQLFTSSALIFNIHIFRFKMDAGLQVYIYFNTEFEFSCLRSSFFSTLNRHSKPTKPMKLLSFLSIWWV